MSPRCGGDFWRSDMPTSAEMIDLQYNFEEPRGLLDHNTGTFALHRLCDELGEAWEEHDRKDYFKMLKELIDVQVFAFSILGDLCRKLDIAYEEVDRLMIETMQKAEAKYKIEHFKNRSPEEAIAYSRKVWTSK